MKKSGYVLLVSTLAVLLGAGSAMATSLDLTTAGASGTINGAFFQQVPDQSTGTGVIDTFVRLQANDLESGYNTDGTLEFDTKSGLFTHSLLLSDVPLVNGKRQFLLDINENQGGDNEFISLYELELYLGATGDLTGYPNLGDKVWDLDEGNDGDSTIELNFMLNPGSGAGDMFAYIPESFFAESTNSYVYLYSAFGKPNASDDGFEEWAIVGEDDETVPPVPEPATLLLLGFGLVGLAGVSRKLRK